MALQHIDLGTERDKSHWPPGVRPLGIAEDDLIGTDGKGGLYWDGKPIEVRKRLDLTRGERLFALVVGLFTIAGSIGAVAQGWAAAHQWTCQTGLVMAGCPVPSNAPSQPAPAPQKTDR